MKAIAICKNNLDDDKVEFKELAVSIPELSGDFDVLVEVLASSINPVDLKVKAGFSGGKEESKILGWDACGKIIKTGKDVKNFALGDRVWFSGDYNRSGSNAEFQLVDSRVISLAPKSVSPIAASALPLTGITAWESLFVRLGYDTEPSERNSSRPLLIVNGAGGVGSIALQLCKKAGISVTATASRDKSKAWCLKMGANNVVSHYELEHEIESSYSRILCCHDTDIYFDKLSRLISPQGLICFLSSAKQNHNIQALMHKSAGIVWEFIFTRTMFSCHDMLEQSIILDKLARLIDSGVLVSTLTKSYEGLSVKNLEEAHFAQSNGNLVGKQAIDYCKG